MPAESAPHGAAGPQINRPSASRVQSVSVHTLTAVTAAAGRSRRLVRVGLIRWGLGRLIDDAELVVSELVTNAVQAVGVADTDADESERGGLAEIQVRLLLFGASVVVEVWDGDPAPPVLQQAAGADEGGRGLSIVAALAANWNWYPGPHGGKVVWAELPIPPHPRTTVGLPQRSRPRTVTGNTHASVVYDLALLNRVHRALKDL